MGKGGGSSKSTTTSTPYLKNEVKNAANQALGLYNRGQPAYFPEQTYVDYSPETMQALDMISGRATAGSDLMRGANKTIGDTVAGAYLDNNPYIDSVVDTSMNDVVRRYSNDILPGLASGFASSGRYGSGIQQNMTTDAIGQLGKEAMGVASGIRYDNYNNERQRQLQAATLAPSLAQSDYYDAQQLMGVGSAREALEQAKLQDEMDRYWYKANGRNNALDQYISRLSALNWGGGTQTTSGGQAKSPIAGAISGASTGLGIGSLFAAPGATGIGAVGGPWGLAAGAGLGVLGGLFS